MIDLSETWIDAARALAGEQSEHDKQEATVSNEFLDNVDVPPGALDNFDEYSVPEGDALEKAQAGTHKFRAKEASLKELREQYRAKVREYEFAIAEIDRELGE